MSDYDDNSSDADEDQEEEVTDCCGADEVSEKCPDCGHRVCEDCECNPNRGRCWCKYSLRGDASSDQVSKESRGFMRRTFGYRGQFKPIVQVQMEKELAVTKPVKERVEACDYRKCNYKAGDKMINPIKLTDENLSQFVVCETCKSKAYCSEACRTKDRKEKTYDHWTGKECRHVDVCEPYLDNDKMLYVSVALRKYKESFGRYPHPLGKLEGDKPAQSCSNKRVKLN